MDKNTLLQALQQSLGTNPQEEGNTPPALQMQDGDKMHPNDAIAHITKQMSQPQGGTPNQSNLTAMRVQEPGNGIGSWISKMITGHPIMHDVGNPIVGTTNAPNMGNLPDSMRPAPIGTDANGKPVYDYAALQKLQGYEGALATATAKGNISNPKYNFEKLTAMGVPVKDAATLIAANPDGVPEKELAKYQTQTKNTVFSTMVDIKKDMVDVMRERVVGAFEGPQALQKMMGESAQRSANIDRFFGVYKNIQDKGFMATQQERTLLQTEGVRIIAGSAGVVTDDSYNRLASATAAQKVSDWKTWVSNEATPAEFRSFAEQLKSIVDNEAETNASIFAIGQQMSAKMLGHKPPVNYMPNSAVPGSSKPAINLNPDGSIAAPNKGKVRVLNIKTGQTGYVSPQFAKDPKYKPL